MTGKYRAQVAQHGIRQIKREQSKLALEASIVRRRCPVCGEVADIEIAEMADGWEVWRCMACGCSKHYRVR